MAEYELISVDVCHCVPRSVWIGRLAAPTDRPGMTGRIGTRLWGMTCGFKSWTKA